MIVRPNSRRAWLSLAWGVFFFASAAAVLQVLAAPAVERFRDPPYSFRRDKLKERLKTLEASIAEGAPRPPLVVTIGSSRILNAVDCQSTELVLKQRLGQDVCAANFGSPGFGPLHSLVLLGRLLRDGIQPDVVVIDVLPLYLAKSSESQLPKEQWIPITPADKAWLADRDIEVEVTQPDPQGLTLYHSRTDILASCMPKLLPRSRATKWVTTTDAWGGRRTPPIANQAMKTQGLELAKSTYHDTLRDFEIGEAGLSAVRVLLTECRQRRIDAVVVVMPEGPTFRSWYRTGALHELASALKCVTRECGAHLVISSEWIEEQDFWDSHHLLASGAERFSARLTREALEPVLQGRLNVALQSTDATQLR
jgi:hypothetical protein